MTKHLENFNIRSREEVITLCSSRKYSQKRLTELRSLNEHESDSISVSSGSANAGPSFESESSISANDELELKSNPLDFKVQDLTREIKVLETKLEQLKMELKALKHEKEDADKTNETLSISLRTIKKELEDSNHDFEKKIRYLEDKINKHKFVQKVAKVGSIFASLQI